MSPVPRITVEIEHWSQTGLSGKRVCVAVSQGYRLMLPPESLSRPSFSARGRVAVSTRYPCRASAPVQGPARLNRAADAHRRLCLGATNFQDKYSIGSSLDSDHFADGVRAGFDSMGCRGPRRRGCDTKNRVECGRCDGWLARCARSDWQRDDRRSIRH